MLEQGVQELEIFLQNEYGSQKKKGGNKKSSQWEKRTGSGSGRLQGIENLGEVELHHEE